MVLEKFDDYKYFKKITELILKQFFEKENCIIQIIITIK
jgi:hypothetical protein